MHQPLQSSLPFAPWADPVSRKLPGVRPVDVADWIVTDDAYGAQMCERDRLIADARDVVVKMDETARPAALELLDMVLEAVLKLDGYRLSQDVLTRPDGVELPIDRDDPMAVIGRLCQDDFCILEQRGTEHLLTGAVLCFPASWSLDQKFMRPLIGIHRPVAAYDDDIARRVQRLFDAIRVDQVLWRANWLLYGDASLHQPRREGERRERPSQSAPFVRSERQCLRRLPVSGAVVFSIHTWVVRREDLTPAQEAELQVQLAAGEAVTP